MILSIAFFDIRNNATTIDIVEVDINIWHRHAFWVEKPLKKKCIL